jgi:glycosyltransferase involved in cell wall biosynthesis
MTDIRVVDDRDMSPKFKFQIITPNLNGGAFLADAIASVACQKIPAHLLIKDAGSTDNSERVARDADPKSGKITFQVIPDSGQSEGLNQALEICESEIIGWLNSDEYYFPDTLRTVEECFDETDADVIFGDCLFVNEYGMPIRLKPGHRFSSPVLRGYGCYISSCTVFIKRELFVRLGFDTEFRRAMDWDLWLRLPQDAKVIHIPKTLAAFRVHGEQVTNRPEILDATEFQALADKHNLRSNPVFWNRISSGSVRHFVLKLMSGAYCRQIRYITLKRNVDTRWFNRDLTP